jgi:multidrug efflux pump subunit AcrA (membrane-fusion protein)
MANTITKAQLEAQLAELQEALAAAQSRTTDLEQQLEAQASQAQEPERRDQLEQIVWIQRNCPSFENETMRWSQDGDTLILNLATQYSSLDRKTGQRVYGARKWFTVIGELAERVRDHYEASDVRLVRIGAYERPIPPKPGSNERRSEWVLNRFEPLPRLDAPAQPVQAAASAPVAAGYGEPTDEEVPF